MKGEWVNAPDGHRYVCQNDDCGVWHKSVFQGEGKPLVCHACETGDLITKPAERHLLPGLGAITLAALRKLMEIGEAARDEWGRRYRVRAELTERRIREGSAFGEGELVYAAFQRCKCGAGYAYPKHIGSHGAWYCSHVLKDPASKPDEHSDALPFSFWSVKSENQPSANGATTRPKA